MKHVFIIKPNKKSVAIEEIIVDVMRSYSYVIKYTNYPKHAIDIARSYQNEHCRIYAVGGDGMVHEVVQGMVGSQNELVVIPNGTGNDFIKSIADTYDAKKLLQASLSLEAQYIDLLKMNDIYCINVACCAFDSDIGNHVHDYKKTWFLPSALQYSTVLLRRIMHYKFFPTTLSYQGKEIFNNSLVIGAFCNAKYFGGGFKIGNEAVLQDGKFDVCLVTAVNKRNLPKYLILLSRGKIQQAKECSYQQMEQVDLISSKEINIDGETYPKGEYHLEIVSNKIKIVLFK
jgi:YegS/Rv2252/BmrU family lipid kinase